MDAQDSLTSYFAASAFVDDTIWVGNCLFATQKILDIVSKFFSINNISINTSKTVTIPINQKVKDMSLSISSSNILVAKKRKFHQYLGIFISSDGLSKPSLAKAHSDVRFFSNVVLKKAITEKQFLYLVSAVLQPIVSYRFQFSCVSKSVCDRWNVMLKKGLKLKTNLLKDFPSDALHYPELFGLRTFEQVLTENLLASLISFANANPMDCFLFGITHALVLCNLSLDGDMFDVFQAGGGVTVLDVLGSDSYLLATASDITTLEYYQSIYTHCKQRFEIRDRIIVFKKTLFQYIKNRINDYLFGNYNITIVKRDLLENILHYSNTESENISAEACTTYFEELDYNIIWFCKEKYPANAQFAFELEFEPETRTSSKLPLTITPFPASLAQAQTPNSPLNRFARPEDFTSLRSPTRQQEPLQTSSNLLDFLAENQSEHSETAVNEENNSEITEKESIDSENEEDEMTTYITKIPDFNGEDIETSPQEWLDQVTKAGDANGWNATRMLRTISYFLKGTAGEWFENLAVPFNDWNAFKAAFLEQFTDNNTSITLRNQPSESVMTYIGKFNKLLRRIRQLKTNDYYSNAQILDQFIAGLKDKLIKKHAKRYEMAMEEANRTKLVNLAIGETSSAAEEKIDQLTKKIKNYFTNQQQQRYQPPQRQNQNNFAPLSNNQPQNCHYCRISGHWKRDCRKLQQDQQNRGNQHYSPPQQSYYQLSPPAYYPPRPQYQNNYYQPASQPIQQQYQQPFTQYYQVPARRLITQNQFTPQN
ncbi:hypothetical protein G9A89_017745 [Geosiphon pyriformis]|nr:hypothetical protein G9A89_017745 [Geosiphon pyriformis]